LCTFFLKINGRAQVYVQKSAFDSYYSIHEKPVFIGLPGEISGNPRIVTVNDWRHIDEELEIFNIYSDNGYSGTSFDRPAFQQMMKILVVMNQI